ncbi:MAG: hypothetical protein HOP02_01135 [Methylococcaceae bacterium]|nr:hypothetical protein [Methylococcaceae bacterium]
MLSFNDGSINYKGVVTPCAPSSCLQINLNFSYDTDTQTVTYIPDNSSLFSGFHQDLIGNNIIGASFVGPQNLSPASLSTGFQIDPNNLLNPLSLTHFNPYYPSEKLVYYKSSLNQLAYFATTETLTNLDLNTAVVPLPPSLLLFATSLLGLGSLSQRKGKLNLAKSAATA